PHAYARHRRAERQWDEHRPQRGRGLSHARGAPHGHPVPRREADRTAGHRPYAGQRPRRGDSPPPLHEPEGAPHPEPALRAARLHVSGTGGRARPVRGGERPREGARLRRRPGVRAPAHAEGPGLRTGGGRQREVARCLGHRRREAGRAAVHGGLRGYRSRDPQGGPPRRRHHRGHARRHRDAGPVQRVPHAAARRGRRGARCRRGTGTGVPLDAPLAEVPIGVSETLREGTDLAILAYGHPVSAALEAAEALARDGLEATVVNARFAKPLDAERILALAAATGRFVTVEEHVVAGGFGSAVGELLAERGARVDLEMIGIPDEHVDHGAQKLWRRHYGLDADGIVAAVRRRWPQLVRTREPEESAGRAWPVTAAP